MRHLRSPELRATLYYNADGRCQNCGVELPANWHADHVIPWSVSHHTNVFEMQALCPLCNLRKGSTMTSHNPVDINLEAFRPGQRAAYLKIVDRIRQGGKENQYTAVVLPTRYGKTDVMRASGLTLYREGIVSNILVIAPETILRDQAVHPEKLAACRQRYQ